MVAVFWLLGCQPGADSAATAEATPVTVVTGGTTSSPTTSSPTTSSSTTPTTSTTGGWSSEDLPTWCLDFEDGSLATVGEGAVASVEGWLGAVTFVAGEGTSWSALTGEEGIDLRGRWALGLRSNHEGSPEAVAIATTPFFLVERPTLTFWQLSEVDGRGVYLGLDVLGEDGSVLASAELPIETGGHVPGLDEEMSPIAELPEVEVGPGVAGWPVLQALDLTDFLDHTVRVRFYQHTWIPDNGFFTLLDGICHGEAPEELAPVAPGGPLSHGMEQ